MALVTDVGRRSVGRDIPKRCESAPTFRGIETWNRASGKLRRHVSRMAQELMDTSSNEYVGRAMDVLRIGLLPFVSSEIASLGRDLDLARYKNFLSKPVSDMDVSNLLALMETAWPEVFQQKLSRTDRSLVVELRGYRNRWAHQDAIGWRDADRALDSCERLLGAVGANEQAHKAAEIRREVARQRDRANRDLIATVKGDNVSGVRDLIQLGADVNTEDHLGHTPLMWARSNATTEALVEAGARVDVQDRRGWTALMWVISPNYVPPDAGEIAATLIEAGASRDLRDHQGKTALDWARHHRRQLRAPRLQRIADELIAVLTDSQSTS